MTEPSCWHWVMVTPEPLPVADLGRFLAGRWRLERDITDRFNNCHGRFTGLALFRRAGNGLRYRERGRLCWQQHEYASTRRYLFRLTGPGRGWVEFADGRAVPRLGSAHRLLALPSCLRSRPVSGRVHGLAARCLANDLAGHGPAQAAAATQPVPSGMTRTQSGMPAAARPIPLSPVAGYNLLR